MKRLFSGLLLLGFCSFHSVAQISHAGTPFTLNPVYSNAFSSENYIPQLAFVGPDLGKLELADAATPHTAFDNVHIGSGIPADISFPSAGVFTKLDDGRQVWRTKIYVPGGLALGLYYDKFNLPAGVSYYLSNANGKQLLGAYTAENNPDDGNWATEKVQGELVNLEMDIEADVDVSQISMHIDNVMSFYRSLSYLQTYADQTYSTIFKYNTSSPCEINAVCPIGTAFPEQRHATVHIEYTVGSLTNREAYAGSGTMMNNTARDCTPYVLTASHVEPTNSTLSTTFSGWIFYFNYETPACANTTVVPASTQTVTGATFVARASYNQNSNQIVGDFLLVKLKNNVPTSYGSYLMGWDISSTVPTGTVIGFHHPSGDAKKVSTSTHIFANGNFNGGQANSHWSVAPWDNGGMEEGSSGSGLFNASGRLIGDLSGGAPSAPSCTDTNSSGDEMANFSEYSKLSLNWLYTYQQPSSAATRLKDWLDPNNTGATTLDAMSTCYVTSVTKVNAANNTVVVFPSPSNGMVYINGSFGNAAIAKVEVYNIIGDKVLEAETTPLLNNYQVDLTNKAPGVYLVRVSAGSSTITKKVVIAK